MNKKYIFSARLKIKNIFLKKVMETGKLAKYIDTCFQQNYTQTNSYSPQNCS